MQVPPDAEDDENEEAEEDEDNDIDMTSRTLATQEKTNKTRKPNTPNKATKATKANATNKSKKQSNSGALNLQDICSDVDENDKMDGNGDEDDVASISDPTEMISPSKISRNSLSQKRRILYDEEEEEEEEEEDCIRDDINISVDNNLAEGNKLITTKKLFRVELDSDPEMSGSESNEFHHKDDEDNDNDSDGEGGYIKEDDGPVKRDHSSRFRPPSMKVSCGNYDTKGTDEAEDDGCESGYRRYKRTRDREVGDNEDEEEEDDENNSDDSYGSIIDKDYDKSYLLEEEEEEEEEEEDNFSDSGNLSNEENILNNRGKKSQVIDKSYTKQKRNKLSMRY